MQSIPRFRPLATLSVPASAKPASTNLPLGYLRAFIIVMVVLHHSVLAYYAKGPAITKGMTLAPRWWEAFPVVDAAKWSGFTPFILFNDSYTMAVLFLVSGLFSWNSLKRKKAAAYLRHRLVRLGIPLLFMCLLSPGTYYLVYLQAGLHDGFWHEWFSLHDWPGGPAWFLAALLIFDLIAVLIYQLLPRGLERAGESIARIQTPSGMLLLLTLVSSTLYVPALLRFGPYGAGLLFLPVSRVLHDLSYFLVGLALGSAAAGPGIIVAGGRLASRWLPLSVSTAAAFALWQATIFLSHRLYNPALWNVAIGTAFCLSCAISTLTALSISLHFVTRSVPFWNSLLACSFGIYLIHYLVVSWIQFGLLSIAAPGWLKGAVTFVLAFSICWGVVRVARRSPAIAGII